MNRRNNLLALLTITITGLLGVGCSGILSTADPNIDDPWGVLKISPGKKIQIGVALSNMDTGEGLESVRGIELALQDHQNVRNFPFETVRTDTECSAVGGETAATDLLSNTNIVAVIGPDCSAACQAAMPILNKAYYTAISPGCGASDLSDPVLHYGSFVRTITPDSAEGYLAAEYAYETLGIRRAAVIDDGSLDTADVAEAFTTRFVSMGGKVVIHETLMPEEQEAQTVLEDISAADVELIYAPLTAEEAISFVDQRREFSDLTSIPALGGRHYSGDWFLEAAQDKAEGIYAIGPLFTSGAFEDAAISYQNKYREAPTGAAFAYAYDATSILISALNRATSVDRQGNLLIGRKRLQEEIYSTAGYAGLTGELTCTTWGNCGMASLAVSQVQMSKWVVVYIP